MFVKNYNKYIGNLSKNLGFKYEPIEENLYVKSIHDLFEIDFPINVNFDPFTILDEPLTNDLNKDWVAFAEYLGYEWYYALDKKTGKIILIDLDSNDLDLYCAENFNSFILAMSLVLEFEALAMSKQEKNRDKIIKSFFEKCVETAGGNVYKDFYCQILGYIP